MIADIFFEWNVLTGTMVAWLGTVVLTVGIDIGPEIYRENKARKTLHETLTRVAEQRLTPKPIVFNPDATMQLGVFKIHHKPVQRRRHAKIAA